jgi:hypothetical protein
MTGHFVVYCLHRSCKKYLIYCNGASNACDSEFCSNQRGLAAEWSSLHGGPGNPESGLESHVQRRKGTLDGLLPYRYRKWNFAHRLIG